jgi:hypothetical protein
MPKPQLALLIGALLMMFCFCVSILCTPWQLRHGVMSRIDEMAITQESIRAYYEGITRDHNTKLFELNQRVNLLSDLLEYKRREYDN